MPAITLTITIDVPEGTAVGIEGGELDATEEPERAAPAWRELVEEYVSVRYREWVLQYLERCEAELGCTVELPNAGRGDYLNVYPPARCRRARVAGVTYSSS